MKVDGFVIGGIANIESVSLEIGDINALVAPNGYGKSNVLHAIGFGIGFLRANESVRKQMLSSRFIPINGNILRKNFRFEINGSAAPNGKIFQYGYECRWSSGDADGCITAEWFKVKSSNEKRYRVLINREGKGKCLIVPSVTGRCTKSLQVSGLQLALPIISVNDSFMSELAKVICNFNVPNIETLNNPESFFSADGAKGVQMLDGMTLCEYIYNLRKDDKNSYGILCDGLTQLIPGVDEFEPSEIVLGDGQSRIYDIIIKEKHNAQNTSIRQLSSGSKRIVFLFTLCVAARKQNIPLIMMEEPENSIHPQLMENLLLMLQTYTSDTKILMTSHSPYLMRYMGPDQMYFGLPKGDGLAHFAKVNPSKLKYLYKYAGDLELTFGEFMFDFMLDLNDAPEKLSTFFKD